MRVKYSIIVPVYNTEKYLKRCLDSIINQSFKDFEIIVVDDGSTDNSLKLLSNYKDKIKLIKQKHSGQSTSRNTGIKNANGQYFIFIDSDDYIDKDHIKIIDEHSNENPDVIRFGIKKLIDNKWYEFPTDNFTCLNGIDAFNRLAYYKYLDSPCVYAIKTEFYKKNRFTFDTTVVGHEDFGLLPKLIIKAEKVSSFNNPLYNYIIRKGSVMTNPATTKKKAEDMIHLGSNLLKEKVSSGIYYDYIANSMIDYIAVLKNRTIRKKYIKELKRINIRKYLLKNSLKKKIKYIICLISLRTYANIKQKVK